MMIKRDQSSLESDKEKKNEKSERSENQRKRMVFFFFFKVDWIRKIWNLNHRHEI